MADANGFVRVPISEQEPLVRAKNFDEVCLGYTEEEAADKIAELALMHSGKIVVKYGRYIPNQEPHIDNVLGVSLASDNQYAKEYNFL